MRYTAESVGWIHVCHMLTQYTCCGRPSPAAPHLSTQPAGVPIYIKTNIQCAFQRYPYQFGLVAQKSNTILPHEYKPRHSLSLSLYKKCPHRPSKLSERRARTDERYTRMFSTVPSTLNGKSAHFIFLRFPCPTQSVIHRPNIADDLADSILKNLIA